LILGVAITKQMTWRGNPQEFSNVYHYQIANGSAQTIDDALIDRLVAIEKSIHGNGVTFKLARSWGPAENPPATNFTRRIKDLTGTGSLTSSGTIYFETAVLLQWPLGRYGSKNRPQKLRKWYHCQHAHSLDTTGGSVSGAPAAALTTALGNLNPITFTAEGAPFTYPMTSKTGHEPIGAGSVYPFLEHRQLGR
jgi:hypothetical protein